MVRDAIARHRGKLNVVLVGSVAVASILFLTNVGEQSALPLPRMAALCFCVWIFLAAMLALLYEQWFRPFASENKIMRSLLFARKAFFVILCLGFVVVSFGFVEFFMRAPR